MANARQACAQGKRQLLTQKGCLEASRELTVPTEKNHQSRALFRLQLVEQNCGLPGALKALQRLHVMGYEDAF